MGTYLTREETEAALGLALDELNSRIKREENSFARHFLRKIRAGYDLEFRYAETILPTLKSRRERITQALQSGSY